jgi:hypothetical protein
MASSVPPPLYDQVQRGSARIRGRDCALARLRTISYPTATALGAALGAVATLGDHLARVFPSLNPQLPAWHGLGRDLLFTTLCGALVVPLALMAKRAVARVYLRVRYGERAP